VWRTLGSQPVAEEPPEVIVRSGNRQQLLKCKEVIIGDSSWYFPKAELSGTVWCLGGMKGRTYLNHLTLYLSEAARECFLVKLFGTFQN
jgi:hypothetical protein